MNEIYPFATKWEVRKYRLYKFSKKMLRWGIGLAIFTGLLLGTFLVGQALTIDMPHRDLVIDNLPRVVEQLKNEVVATLESCESREAKEPWGLITFDPDKTGKAVNIPSIGGLQFKVKTVQHYVKQFEGRDITQVEAISIATNPERARSLAKKVVFEAGKGDKEWVTCFRRHNLNQEIEIIKKLK